MNSDDLRIGFIGGGNMTQAIVGGLLRAGHAPEHLTVSDPSTEQLGHIQSAHPDIQVSDDNNVAVGNSNIVVLAVKPQIMSSVINGLDLSVEQSSRVYLSIAAGITLNSLQSQLNSTQAIVRIMPNQPALVGAGMSVLIATSTTTAEQKASAQYVAEAMGDTAWVEDEPLMDAVTAVSGSGPAYFYLFMEIIEACAVDMGLPKQLARKLARQTAFGAGQVAAKSALELKTLRTSVTSKGGTTAAAIRVLEQPEFRAIVARALLAARDRSIELGHTD